MPHTSCSRCAPKVAIETPMGPMLLELYADRAPLTVANFLAYVEQELFDDTSFFRIANQCNQTFYAEQEQEDRVSIDIVQGGLPPQHPALLPPIAHETTERTGIRHLDGVISMARFEPGTADGSFFFCVGDQPELDFGGRRYADGQGFAAFGRIIRGRDILQEIFALAEEEEYLAKAVPILTISAFQ